MSLLPKNLETLKRNAKKNIMPLLTPYLLKLRINTYAPYIGAGIKIEHINLDQGLCVVSMGLNSLNKNIEFIAPGNSKVTARMKIPSNEITTIQELAKEGEPVFREYQVDIVDDQQKTIAIVTKKLYIRLRKYSKSKDQSSRIENLDD